MQRCLIAPLVAALPAGGHDWVKQFLHGQGLCSRGLQTALGPTVGAMHIVARTGIASFTGKRRYPRQRPVDFGLHHVPQRIPDSWIDAYFAAFVDLPPRSLHHAIAAHLARMVLGGIPTNTNLSEAVLPLGMSRSATGYVLAHVSDRLADSGRQAAFDQAIDALAEHLHTTRHELTDYGRLNPTANYVSNRWRALTTRDGLYQPLSDRLNTYLSDITRTIDSGTQTPGQPGQRRQARP